MKLLDTTDELFVEALVVLLIMGSIILLYYTFNATGNFDKELSKALAEGTNTIYSEDINQHIKDGYYVVLDKEISSSELLSKLSNSNFVVYSKDSNNILHFAKIDDSRINHRSEVDINKFKGD